MEKYQLGKFNGKYTIPSDFDSANEEILHTLTDSNDSVLKEDEEKAHILQK